MRNPHDWWLALGNELLVNTTTPRQQAFADIAVTDDNTALVTWSSRRQDGSDWGVYGQRLSADGTKLGGEFRVAARFANGGLLACLTPDELWDCLQARRHLSLPATFNKSSRAVAGRQAWLQPSEEPLPSPRGFRRFCRRFSHTARYITPVIDDFRNWEL